MRKINPSVKVIVILLSALIISFSPSVFWNVVIIALCFISLLLSGCLSRKVLNVLLPATLASLSIFTALLLRGGGGEEVFESSGNFLVVSSSASNIEDALAVALRIYVYAFLGMLFSFTTDPQAFVYSLMQQCRLDAKFAYGVLAAWNLLPMIKREYDQTKLAILVRGVKLCPWSMKPLFTALVNALHWAENVAMAMESKGFDGNEARTYYIKLQVRYYDFIWAIFMLAVSMAWIWF